MPERDDIDAVYRGCGFSTTQWTEILRLQSADEVDRRALVGRLAERYWPPVYAFLRRSGNDPEAAKDLAQDFFFEVVLGRQLFQQADPARGRFRTFLLTALRRYTTQVHRSRNARK
jgi:RNA polymerase sigma-70 factor (ECF subfamily)